MFAEAPKAAETAAAGLRPVRAPSQFVFFNDTATTEIYTLSLHDALPIFHELGAEEGKIVGTYCGSGVHGRSEEHTSELQSLRHLVCRLLLEKKVWHCFTPSRPATRPTQTGRSTQAASC